MNNDIDIVDRLRISWTSMTAMGNAEREEAADEIEQLREQLRLANIDNFNTTAEVEQLRDERDEARTRTGRILNEIDCRIEHGAESNGHLEAIRNLFKENTDER